MTAAAAHASPGAASGVSAAAKQQQQQDEDAVVSRWQQSYPMPDEDQASGLTKLRGAYRPPRSDLKGVAIALTIIGSWLALFYHGCWQLRLSPGPRGPRSSWLDIAATFFALEFASTGLFITCHDAMHGTICYSNRRLNDLLGRVAITLYAYFNYDMLHRNHWEHHQHTGVVGKDPDFHRGNTHILAWFANFMWHYSTLLQFAKIGLASQVLQALGVPYANLCVYMAGAPILAAFRLFYFGTYLPHYPAGGDPGKPMPWQASHSSDAPFWLTFLQCYNFGLHREHHWAPYAPWWQLPQAKRLTRSFYAAQQQHQQQQQVHTKGE